MIAVVSQSPDNTPARRHFEEELVAALMMEDGIDVNVIPHVEHLESDSTGLLCLEGIRGDLLLLAWLEPQAALRTLRACGIDGRLGATALSPSATTAPADALAGNRAIFCLDLRGQHTIQPLLSEVRRIRDDNRVQTFEILGVLPARPIPAASGIARPASEPAPCPLPVPPLATNAGEPDDDHLERLLDDLDTMNL
jgi:hypothetical protein